MSGPAITDALAAAVELAGGGPSERGLLLSAIGAHSGPDEDEACRMILSLRREDGAAAARNVIANAVGQMADSLHWLEPLALQRREHAVAFLAWAAGQGSSQALRAIRVTGGDPHPSATLGEGHDARSRRGSWGRIRALREAAEAEADRRRKADPLAALLNDAAERDSVERVLGRTPWALPEVAVGSGDIGGGLRTEEVAPAPERPAHELPRAGREAVKTVTIHFSAADVARRVDGDSEVNPAARVRIDLGGGREWKASFWQLEQVHRLSQDRCLEAEGRDERKKLNRLHAKLAQAVELERAEEIQGHGKTRLTLTLPAATDLRVLSYGSAAERADAARRDAGYMARHPDLPPR